MGVGNAIDDDLFETDSLQRNNHQKDEDHHQFMENVVGGYSNDQLCLVDALNKLEQEEELSEESNNADMRAEEANMLAKQYEQLFQSGANILSDEEESKNRCDKD